MGSSLEAWWAGWNPKNRPTAAAVPRPLATNDLTFTAVGRRFG